MTASRLLIVGGGIAGLSAAYFAVKKNEQHDLTHKITLVDSASRWGGKITTDRVVHEGGQFIIEGGPDTFLATKPWASALCRELGLGERLHGTNPRLKNTYVIHRGRLMPLPDGLALMIPTNIPAILKSGLISWPGKTRMGLDFLISAAAPDGDESLGAFISRRLGREAYENLIEPLMSGIYAGDGDALSLASTFPYLRDLELKYGSLARGALKMRAVSRGKPVQGSRSAFLTPTTGLAEIVESLVAYLNANGADMRLNTSVTLLEKRSAKYQAEYEDGIIEEFDSIILATPAFISGRLVSSLDFELAGILDSIPYASTATVSLAYRLSDIPRSLDGYGYVIPRREGREALACTWTSTKFPHRAPEGFALLRVFIGRAGEENRLPDDQDLLIGIASRELELTLGIKATPLITRIFVWRNSMPQYNLGHPEKLAAIANCLEKHPGLALAGNGYRGIGIPDCIHSGELAVDKIFSKVKV